MLDIIPQPKSCKPQNGTLKIAPQISFGFEDCSSLLKEFSALSDRMIGISFSEGNSGVSAVTDKGLAEEEYSVSVSDKVVIKASGHLGFARGLATLLQISKKTEDNMIVLPRCTVEDRPDCPWRGLLIDLARQHHSLELILKYIDICFLFKINRLQLHFTDDESYTMPSRAFPRLPTAARSYSESEIRVIAEKSYAMGVMVVPEIDMPGHSTQFIEKYPEIFGTHGIMAADEKTFNALGQIYREAEELFSTSEYIHCGGDEAVIGRWQDCEKSLAYEKKNHIDGYIELYGHYIGRVTDDILSTGRTPLVWEGFFKESNKYVSKKVPVMEFESLYQLPDTLSHEGYTLINCSWNPLYIVSPWTKWKPEEILRWDIRTWTAVNEKSPAKENPIHLSETSKVLGGQLCAWGDYMKGASSPENVTKKEYEIVVPRLAALSEKTWNEKGIHTPQTFVSALNSLSLNYTDN